MRAIEIALKDIKTIARDFKALAIIIAMPLILIVILGAALGGMFSRSEVISPFKVAIVDLDRGQASAEFMALLSSEQFSKLMTVVPADSEEEALELIRSEKVAASVIIPPGASDFANLTTRTFKVLTDPGRAVSGQVLRGVVESYAEQYSAVSAGVRNVISSFTESSHTHDSPDAGPQGIAGLMRTIQDRLLSETTRAAALFSPTQEQATWITARQYYTASMTVMFVMFGAMLGAKSIIEEKGQKTMSRLFSTKATRSDILVGKTLATYLISVLQILILVAFTSLVYRTGWGDMRGVLLVTGSLALASTGFCMLIAAIAKTEKVVDALENFGIQVMAFLGGCQLPIYIFPAALQMISRMTFTRWGLDGYLALMQGQTWSSVAQPSVVLTGMGLAFLAVGIWRLDLD